MIILLIFLLLIVTIETLILLLLFKNVYLPMQKLWHVIKGIDFRRDSIDLSPLDSMEVSNIGVVNNIILKFKELVDVICDRITQVNEITDVSEHDKLSQCYNTLRLNNYKCYYEQCNNFIIIFIDVNNLKRMNDTLGHEAGDRLIKKAAQEIKFWDTYGDSYRIGGDEFMVVLSNINIDQIMPIITRWQKSVGILAETPEGYKCVLSVGIAEGHHGDSFDIVQRVADKRMYNMKVKIKQQLGEEMR